jgi:hypothetical protein
MPAMSFDHSANRRHWELDSQPGVKTVIGISELMTHTAYRDAVGRAGHASDLMHEHGIDWCDQRGDVLVVDEEQCRQRASIGRLQHFLTAVGFGEDDEVIRTDAESLLDSPVSIGNPRLTS